MFNQTNIGKETGCDEPETHVDLATVLIDELSNIKNISAKERASLEHNGLDSIFKALYQKNLYALCLSGGGIRSATFGLGVIQSLANHNLLDKFDYLSTVSGGGYLGSWLSAWIRIERLKHIERNACINDIEFRRYRQTKYGEIYQKANLSNLTAHKLKLIDDQVAIDIFANNSSKEGVRAVQDQLRNSQINQRNKPNPEPSPVRHLREYSNFMTPAVGIMSADSWAFIGIYLRNLFLNWTIFIPILLSFLLLPRVLYSLTKESGSVFDNANVRLCFLWLGVAAGSWLVGYITNNLPSKNQDVGSRRYNTDFCVLLLGVAPLFFLAVVVTLIWSGTILNPSTFISPIPNLFGIHYDNNRLFNFITFTLSIYLLGYGLFILRRVMSSNPKLKVFPTISGILAAMASSVVSGFLLWFVTTFLFDETILSNSSENFNFELYVCFAVPIFMVIFLMQSTLYVGLASKHMTDGDREWLARFGGWILILTLGWIVVTVLVLFGPVFINYIFDWDTIAKITSLPAIITPVVVVLSGALSLIGGFSARSSIKKTITKKTSSKIFSIVPQIATIIFLAFIIIGLSFISAIVISLVAGFMSQGYVFLTKSPSSEHMLYLEAIKKISPSFLLLISILCATVGGIMACFVNVNKFSLHGAYRDRLIRAYLGASNAHRDPNSFTGFDERDNRQLHRLKGQKPFHIINATLNLVGSNNLAWQTRKAASFTMSPLHSGSWLLGYRGSNKYSRNPAAGKCKHLRYCNELHPCNDINTCSLQGNSLRLGTAMAISGAAADPNMGYYSSPIVTFLLSLFNIRLGWWLGNTGSKGNGYDRFILKKGGRINKQFPAFWRVFNYFYPSRAFFTKSSPTIAVFPLLNEAFGRTSEEKRYLRVTDGGHFENLGLYEMVMRRCKFIVVSDAAADEKFTFGEISNAIEKCKVDLGVEIKFRKPIDIYNRHSTSSQKRTGQRFAVADILYPETGPGDKKHTGCLLYFRPTLNDAEPINIKNYAESNSAFPHQSTGDQFFDERQFEAYRELGFLTFEEILNKGKAYTIEKLHDYICSQNRSTNAINKKGQPKDIKQ